VSVIFDWPYEVLLANTEEMRQRRNALPSRMLGGQSWDYRRALQVIGTDLFRDKFSPTIGTEVVELKIEPLLREGVDVVVTDTRFITEINMLNKKGAIMLLLWRNPADIVPLPGEHVSENEFLVRCDEMTVVENTSNSKNDLYKKIDQILTKKADE
jgi:hypothetical protein